MADNYKPGRAVVVGELLGAFIGLLTRRPIIGAILGMWIGLAVDASNKAKRDKADK